MKLFFLFLMLSTILVKGQTDFIKWGKANYSYQLSDNTSRRDYSINSQSFGRIALKTFADAYWIFISDVDGDNCSFSPTCSNFFIQSVEKTNIVQGTLMFFDRFTRDMDIFGKLGHYPSVPDGHFYDPISLYTLNPNKIKYIPPQAVVKNE